MSRCPYRCIMEVLSSLVVKVGSTPALLPELTRIVEQSVSCQEDIPPGWSILAAWRPPGRNESVPAAPPHE